MKKALVIAFVLVLGLGVAAFAGPLSGSWSMWAQLTVDKDIGEALRMPAFGTTLELDYTVCGWTFGSTAKFSKHAFDNLWFDAVGSVGAFGFYGVLDFVPQTPSFKFLAGFVDVSIAGVTLYAGGMLYNFGYATLTPDIGSGFIVGGYGAAGACSIWVEAQFNMAATIGTVYWYGYDSMIEWILYYDTDECAWYKPGLTVQTAGCTAAWSGLDIYIEYPFACFDLLTTVNFNCTVGFNKVGFYIDDIDLGIPWLLLDDLNIVFTVQTKSVCGQFELVLADTTCFTPYLSLVMDPTHAYITGIALNALTIEYDMGQGVTFKAGTLFNRSWGDTGFAKVGDTATCDGDYAFCWTHAGELLMSGYYGTGCCVDYGITGTARYDEYFAILIDGDACCGGAFSVSAFTWFDDDQTDAFMDWVETEVDISVGFGSNTTLSVGFDLKADGLDNMVIGVKFIF